MFFSGVLTSAPDVGHVVQSLKGSDLTLTLRRLAKLESIEKCSNDSYITVSNIPLHF